MDGTPPGPVRERDRETIDRGRSGRARTQWDDLYNAEIYDGYVRDFPIYRELNRRLAELARLDRARRVLDVACGTGATALACLARLPWEAELVGLDAAAAMVEVARHQVVDPRARFEVAAAAAVDRAVEGVFDRAVCNTAFWQFPSAAPVLVALSRVLEKDALFVWNVPAERVEGEEAATHPFQRALGRAAAEAAPGDDAPSLQPTRLDPEHLEQDLDAAGFELVAVERHVYRGEQGELMELMRIPAMAEPLFPHLAPEARDALVERAARGLDPSLPIEVPWIYFTARRR